ncbi:response regulator transcription factor [Thiohalophilus thiocyanatoxydans]|uniref:Response regulator receiver domain-containing protein n=1 Tax=Thiohalophilus thiocyanatoxydans TaxID=381308 RepID=A0A4R8IFR2_9GAMM|nr:response regulator [Thiohalophilus thiocyanatoxydans]TDX99365.1 response regulator receiver domain-containing protein [Thiohalophilus thiocyanatoxydans]
MSRAQTNHQGTLLILEKDEHTAYLLDYLLSREGYSVISTTDCEIASQLLAKIPPTSMIFLDVAFCSDGQCRFMDTLRHIPAWRDTPVLLLAEHYTMEDVSNGLQAGANDYIVQPFHHAELLKQIKRYSLKLHHA